MKKPSIPGAAALLLVSAPPAHAAEVTLGLTLFGAALVVIACIGVIIAVNDRLQTVKRDHAELVERLFNSERTVNRLQQERADMEQAIADRDEFVAQANQERDEIETMLAELREQVNKTARIDGLTGVANRKQLDKTLEDEIKRAVRARRPLALLLAEIDFFDDYRAQNSSLKADRAIQQIAGEVADTFRRAGDLVARADVARFAVVLPGSDEETAARFAEKLRRAVYDMCIPFTASEIADRMTVSVGMVCVPTNRLNDNDAVLRMAETALRQAQADGFNRVAHHASAA